MLRIILSRLGSPEHAIDLHDRTLRIGRGAGNEILLRDPDKTVSRTHGEVRREAVGWVFIDNDSQNGSWVEGRRVDRVVLKEGVAISFGDYELTCEGTGVTHDGETVLDERAGEYDLTPPPDATVVAGSGALGPEDHTMLATDLRALAAPLPQADTTPRRPAPPTARDTGARPSAPAPDTAPDEATIYNPWGIAAPDADEDAATIVVPSEYSAAPPASTASRPAPAWPPSAPATATRPSVDDEHDADAATIVVPSAPAAGPAPVGERQTTLAAAAPVFPSSVTPATGAFDVTVPVPADLSELFRPAPAPSATQPEDLPTVLMPGRPPTGQLTVPPVSSGEHPAFALPPLPPYPPPPGSPDTGPHAVGPGVLSDGTPMTAAVPASPFTMPSAPATGVSPTPAEPVARAVTPPPPTSPSVPVPATPVTSVPAAAVVPPAAPSPTVTAPGPARPAAAPAPGGGAGRSSALPAVLVWGIAWLALFALVGLAVWMWMSRGGGADETPPPTQQAPATPGSQAPPPAPAAQPAPAVAQPEPAASEPNAVTAPPPSAPAVTPTPPAPPGEPTSRATVSERTPPTATPRRPAERSPDARPRTTALERQYTAGRDALAAGRALEARDLLRSVAAEAPTYKDVDGLLRDAEAAVRRESSAALATAERLEQANEYDKALAAYRRAEQLGAASDQVGPATQRVQRAMQAAGDKAFRDARQFDGLGRNADAARLYEQALRFLPEGDPRRAQARQRLDALAAARR